jgi:hydrogenase expression/formation protein HypE
LFDSVFRTFFSNPALDILSDAAIVSINGQHIAFTTDSYVIDPLFFPGGDIGKLAVSGTINDLCVSGAIPKYITAGFIIEEGFSVSDLQVIAKSMAIEAKNAGIYIVAGDTKVVKRGQCDKLFINTSGIGILPDDRLHINDGSTILQCDKILVTGPWAIMLSPYCSTRKSDL